MSKSLSAVANLEQFLPRQDAAAKLLVLLARPQLSDDQRQMMRSFAATIENWDELVQMAADKFVVTLVHRHLRTSATDIVSKPALERMRLLAQQSTMATLRVVAAQVGFHAACIKATNVKHAYLKGVALAQQFDQCVGERYCRDIDVLIGEKDFATVVSRALASGYRILIETQPFRFAEKRDDIDFLSRYADVVVLVGRDGVPIELHRRLDKLSLKFDLDYALASAAEVVIAGQHMKTLSKPLHFVYSCYHHSRHFWSHLHWLADLDAMIGSKDLDRLEVNILAEKIGIRPTVDAAFELHRLTGTPSEWNDLRATDSGGRQFLYACLVNLRGDLELEKHLRQTMALNDFISRWQISPGRYQGFWFYSWARRLRPTVTQHFEQHYPRYLQWIYWVQNAAVLAKNGLMLAFGSAADFPKKILQGHSPSAGDQR